MTNIETYQEQKTRQAEELNKFEGLFFAFSNKQLKEGLEKIGLAEGDTDKIYSLGAGGYILKEKSKEFNDMFKRHAEEKKERKQDEKYLLEALAYELNNHEYCVTYDVTEALDALGWSVDSIDPKILKKACSMAV